MPSGGTPTVAITSIISGSDPPGWRRIIDTSLASPADYSEYAEGPVVEEGTYRAGPRSVVLLAQERS